MPTWLVDLPQKFPLESSFDVVDGRVQWDPEAGPPITRSRFTAEHKIHTLALVLRDFQVNILEAWYEDDLNGGSLGFDWTNPWSGAGLKTFKFQKRPSYGAPLHPAITIPEATGNTVGAFTDSGVQRRFTARFSLIDAAFSTP